MKYLYIAGFVIFTITLCVGSVLVMVAIWKDGSDEGLVLCTIPILFTLSAIMIALGSVAAGAPHHQVNYFFDCSVFTGGGVGLLVILRKVRKSSLSSGSDLVWIAYLMVLFFGLIRGYVGPL